ncbi:hypothetical protein Lepto7375DRAFT_6436 [Leptolyngbya sp. PCC 7375]|nr:hypothetical protein Lepto7375DRAFT_6436 [Leptolyngbya sp. PCC 7375]
MLQDAKTIRYYQRITDALVDQWNRGYRNDDLRRYLEGYLAALRHSDALEPYLIHRLEDEVNRFLFDSSNFAVAQPQPEHDYR